MSMWISATEEPALKRVKKSPSPPSSSPLSSLPDELVLSCLARTSRSDQAALSLVSRGYRSLVASPEAYKTRSLMGLTETYTYVCMRSCLDENPRWYILRRGKSENRLVRIPVPFSVSGFSLPTEGSSVVALDWGIYVIGGLIKGKLTAKVWLLDCRTHTWRRVPSMGVYRTDAAAGIVAGKIYVFGGCIDPDSSHWAEAFDPKTQTWETLDPLPDLKMRSKRLHDTVVVKEEKVYIADSKGTTFYYSPSDGKWGRGNNDDSRLLDYKRDWCVIGKLIFSLGRCGRLWWCEQDQLEAEQQAPEKEGIMYWKEVKGLDSLKTTLSSSRLFYFDRMLEAAWEAYMAAQGRNEKLVDSRPGARLSSSGGSNIVLFWDVIIEGYRPSLEIWAAEISLERRQGGEIWGNFERSNALKTVDHIIGHDYKVLHSVSVTF